MSRLAILGAGSWGTALAIILAPRFESVGLWVHEPGLAARLQDTRSNELYLPGFCLPGNVAASSEFAEALAGADTVVGVVPSRFTRGVFEAARPWLSSGAIIVSATKGLEHGSLLRMSEVLAEVVGPTMADRIAVLSGPTFAREVAAGEPAAVVVAANCAATAQQVQAAFSGPSFRLYTNDDPVGVELGAALKNVIAIAAGVCEGLGLGNNTVAALITRGLAEMTRLACAGGASPRTLAGLAGLGDLVLTCKGELSRNRRVGIELAKGQHLASIVSSSRMIAEGVETTSSALALAQRWHIDMPITGSVQAVLHGQIAPQAALQDLMNRTLKYED